MACRVHIVEGFGRGLRCSDTVDDINPALPIISKHVITPIGSGS